MLLGRRHIYDGVFKCLLVVLPSSTLFFEVLVNGTELSAKLSELSSSGFQLLLQSLIL